METNSSTGLLVDFWMILFTIPVLVLLALQSDLGTALVFVAIFSGIVLLSGVSWKIIIPVFVTAVTGIAGFLAILSVRTAGLFSINWECRPIKSTVFWLGLIHLTLPKLPLTSRLKGKSRLGVVAYLVKVLMLLICLSQFESRI